MPKSIDLKQNKKVVYFVRHGQSFDNARPVFQSTESPLNELGERQALLIANRVSKLEFDRLISSPTLRARQTAEAISEKTGRPIEFSELFVERRKPKAIEGKPYTDFKANKIWREWDASLYLPGVKIKDGESFDTINERAGKALDFLEARPEQKLVVVTHGFFLQTVLAKVLFGDKLDGDLLRRFKSLTSVENTSITVLRYEDAFEEEPCWRLWTLNDHAHFAE